MEKTELILFHGPPHVGKTLYYFCNLSEQYKYISPSQLFKDDPSLNLRQILRRVASYLGKGYSLVVDDENASVSQRVAYVKYIKSKLPACFINCYSFSAIHGVFQLLWGRQLHTAEQVLKGVQIDVNDKKESRIQQWTRQIQDIPNLHEGLDVTEIEHRLTVQSPYKLEVPVLLIEGASVIKDNQELTSGAAECINTWYKHNMCGRIILLFDMKNTPQVSSTEATNHVKFILTSLIKQCVSFPIYAISCHQMDKHCFSLPPNPGMVAFLQRLHSAHLSCKGSLLLFSTGPYMKMAESAGIKHIKAASAFQRPSLVVSMHKVSKPQVPPVLETMQVVPPVGDWMKETQPCIPLFDHLLTTMPCYSSNQFGEYSLYGACSSKDGLTRYQELYQKNATPINEKDSRIEALYQEEPVATLNRSSISEIQSSRSCSSSGKDRPLPKWMSTKKTPKKKKDFLAQTISFSSLESSKSEKETERLFYLMNIHELETVAKDILVEAGMTIPKIKKKTKTGLKTGKYKADHRKTRRRKPIVYDDSDTDIGEVMVEEAIQEPVERAQEFEQKKEDVLEKTEKTLVEDSRLNILDDLFEENQKTTKKKPPKRAKVTQKCSDSVQAVVDDILSDKSPKYTQRKSVPFKSKLVGSTQWDSEDLFSEPDSATSIPYKRQRTFEDEKDDFTYSGMSSQKSESEVFSESCRSKKKRGGLSGSDNDTCSASQRTNLSKNESQKSSKKCAKLNIPGFSDSEDESVVYKKEKRYTSKKKEPNRKCVLVEDSFDCVIEAKKEYKTTTIPDSFVPETVYTVPETVISQKTKSKSQRTRSPARWKNNARSPEAPSQTPNSPVFNKGTLFKESDFRPNDRTKSSKDSKSHLSILDDLF